MTYARIFQSGKSRAVRLPMEFRQGVEIGLGETRTNAAMIFDRLALLPADFTSNPREDTPPQERETF